jgi:hypothetical protein
MATVVSDPSHPLRVTRPAPSPAKVVAPAVVRPAEVAPRSRRTRSSDREHFFAAIVAGLTGGFTAYGGRRR